MPSRHLCRFARCLATSVRDNVDFVNVHTFECSYTLGNCFALILALFITSFVCRVVLNFTVYLTFLENRLNRLSSQREKSKLSAVEFSLHAVMRSLAINRAFLSQFYQKLSKTKQLEKWILSTWICQTFNWKTFKVTSKTTHCNEASSFLLYIWLY